MRMPDQGEWVFDQDEVESPKTFWWWHKTDDDQWEVVDEKGSVVVSGTQKACIDKLLELVDATPT